MTNSKFSFLSRRNDKSSRQNSIQRLNRIVQNPVSLDLHLPDQIELLQWISFSDSFSVQDAYYGWVDGDEGQVEIIIDYPGLIAASGRSESSIIDAALSFDICGSVTSFYAYTSSGMFICDESSCVNGKLILPIKDIYEQTGCVDVMLFSSGSMNEASTISIDSSNFHLTVEHNLIGITIAHMPTRTHYLEGESFNPLGMVISANYSDGTAEIVRDYSLTNDSPLRRGVSVIASYNDCSCQVPVEVVSASNVDNSGHPSADLNNVNLLTGRLLLSLDTVDIGSNSYNMSISLVYDSAMKSVQEAMFWGCGKGFKLSLDQRVIAIDEDTIEYIDGIGFTHEYQKYDNASNMYCDIDDARNTIRITDDGYELMNDVGDKINFDSDGRSVSFQSNANQSIRKRIIRNRSGQISLVYDDRCDDGRIKRECIVLEYDGGLLDCVRAEMDGRLTTERVDLSYDNNGFLTSVSFFNNIDGQLRLSHEITCEYSQGMLSNVVNHLSKEARSFIYNSGKVVSIRGGHVDEHNQMIVGEGMDIDYGASSENRSRVTSLDGLTREYQFDRERRLSAVFEVDSQGGLRATQKPQGVRMESIGINPGTTIRLNGDDVFQADTLGTTIGYSFASFAPRFVQDFLLSMSIMIPEGCSNRLHIEAVYGGRSTRIRVNAEAVNVWQDVRIPVRFMTGRRKDATNSITIRLLSESDARYRYLFSRPYLLAGDQDQLCIDVNGERVTDSSELLLQENRIRVRKDGGNIINPVLSESDIIYNIVHRDDVLSRGILAYNGRQRIKGVTSLHPIGGDNLLLDSWDRTSVYVERRGLRIRYGTLSRKIINPVQAYNHATRFDEVSYSLDEYGHVQDELDRKYSVKTSNGTCVEEGKSGYAIHHSYSAYGTRTSSSLSHGNERWELSRIEMDADDEFVVSEYDNNSGSKTFSYFHGKLSAYSKSSYTNGTFTSLGPSTHFVYNVQSTLSDIIFSFDDNSECRNQIEYQEGLVSRYHSSNHDHRFSVEWQDRSSITAIRNGNEAPYVTMSESPNVSTTTLRHSNNRQDIVEKVRDQYGRIVSERLNGEEKVTYVYGGADGFSESTSHVTSVNDGYANIQRDFEYDSSGNLIKECIGTFFSSIGYGENSVTESHNVSGGVAVVTRYSNSKVTEISFRENDINQSIETNRYSYDWMGRISSKTGNIGISFEYDGASFRPSRIAYRILNNDYVQQMQYDAESRISQTTIEGVATSYSYDDFGRLIGENRGGFITRYEYDGDFLSSGSSGDMRLEFTNDQNGRMMSRKLKNGARVIATSTYEYDDAGQMTSRTKGGERVEMTWSRGLMSSFGDLSFEYDYLGRRTKKGTISYFYSLTGKLIAQVDGSNSLKFFYDETGPCGFINNQGAYLRYMKNWRGDVIAIVGLFGIVARYEYDAWGNCKVLNPDGSVNTSSSFIGNINPLRYCGYYYDVETSLYHITSRYYDPEIGRFISPDSVDYLDPTTITGLNLYAYCNNDPVNYCDPSGHSAIATIIGLLIAAIAITYVVEQTVRTQQYINENYDGWKKFWLTTSNFTLGFGFTSIISFDADKIKYTDNGALISFDYSKNKNYNIFTSFQFSNAISKNGLPKGRTKGGIWFELLGHHLFNSFDLFDIIQNDNQADMGTFENDNNAWIWELFF